MENTLVFLFVILRLITLSSSHMHCMVEDIQVQPNFQLSLMEGRWYEIRWASFQFVPEEFRFRDYEHRYTHNLRTGGMDIMGMGRPTINEECFYYTGSLSLTGEPGKLLYNRAKSVLSDAETKTTPYWIVATDYDNYAVTYGCPRILQNGTCESSSIESWVWSRNPWLSPSVSDAVDLAMERICMQSDKYMETLHGHECRVLNGAGRLYPIGAIVIAAVMSMLFLV